MVPDQTTPCYENSGFKLKYRLWSMMSTCLVREDSTYFTEPEISSWVPPEIPYKRPLT